MMDGRCENAVMAGYGGALMSDGFRSAPPILRSNYALFGLRLAVKDVFEVEGLRMGAGNPAWFAGRQPAAQSATAVRLLLESGAEWLGKTVTDELTYSLAGINDHYGTPDNPAAPGRIAGGSSSGSASIVAAGLADIALGTDCGGSVRLPASYCGIWGFRPTHGRIATDGCITLAHSFDTVGWFARRFEPLSQVFEVLANSLVPGQSAWTHALVPSFVAGLLDEDTRTRFDGVLRALQGGLAIEHCLADRKAIQGWAGALRMLQASEAWQQHGAWVRQHGDSLGAAVKARFMAAQRIGAGDVQGAQQVRRQAIGQLGALLERPGTLMVLPALPGAAPRRDADAAQIETARQQAQEVLCLAGLAGLPQVVLPWMTGAGAPVGLSLIGPRGSDELVLAAAGHLHAIIGAHA